MQSTRRLTGIVTGALLASLLLACEKPAPATTETPPRPVRVVVPEHGPALPSVAVTGVIVPRDDAKLAFKVGGIIRDIAVHAGDHVHTGQLLASLNTTEIDATVAQARQAYEKAQRDLSRGRKLYAEDVVTREQLDDLTTAEKVAQAQLKAAEFNRSHATIVADSDGTVLQRLAEPRETVGPGTPVLQVSGSTGGWVLKAGVADRDFVGLSLDDTASVTLDALPGRTLQAHVSQLGGAADPRTGTFPIEVAVDKSDAPLAAGLIAQARIERAAANDHSRDYVPLVALVEGDSQSALIFLYDADTQRVRAKQVSVAFIDGDRAALGDPLPAAARVVAEGAAYLHDGDAVRVIE